MTKCTFLCMRNQFRGNLVRGAFKKKKLLRLQKKYFFYHSWEFLFFFGNFWNFVIKFYIKTCLVIIIIFLLSSNKKQKEQKKLNKKSYYLKIFKNLTTCLVTYVKKKRARKFSLKLKLLVSIFASQMWKLEDLKELTMKYRISSISWINFTSGEAKLLMKN